MSGGSSDLGVVAGNRGPIWPLEVLLRDAVAHRLRPVGISAQARSITAERAWSFAYPARASVGLPEPAPVVHRAFVKGKLGALVPSGPLTVGRWFAQGVEGQGELLAGSRAVLRRYVVMSSGVVKPARMSQVCRPAMVRSFRISFRPLPVTCWVGR